MQIDFRMGCIGLAAAWALSGCGSAPPREPAPDPDVVRSLITAHMPATATHRDGWAVDLFSAN